MSREARLVQDWFDGARRPVGERLPPERALARTLGLSRAGLRKGLAELEAGEFLVRQVGRGTFVRTRSAGAPSAERGYREAIDASPRQALEARLVLEPGLARAAAKEGTRAQFAAIEDAERAAAAAADWVAFDLADQAYHRAIAQASTNPVLLRLFDEVMDAYGGVAWGHLLRRDPQDPGPSHASIRDHADIRAAILARDGELAAEATKRHLLSETASLVERLV